VNSPRHFDDDDGKCSDIDDRVWTWHVWCIGDTARLLVSASVTWRRYALEQRGLSARHPAVRVAVNARNVLKAAAVVWFVVGNLWLLTSSKEVACGVGHSLVFIACLVLLGLQYLEICVPFLLALFLVPVFCCCSAPFTSLMASVQDQMEDKGADKSAIDALPVVQHRADPQPGEGGDDSAAVDLVACPICMNTYLAGDILRVLPCEHRFHRTCVDRWLLMNATCPNCRSSIIPVRTPGVQ